MALIKTIDTTNIINRYSNLPSVPIPICKLASAPKKPAKKPAIKKNKIVIIIALFQLIKLCPATILLKFDCKDFWLKRLLLTFVARSYIKLNRSLYTLKNKTTLYIHKMAVN
ncbi:MAG: hypothetical protein RMZ41_021105 [Nostoc sp. DedVER02]|uniref:hypothetical protein n=1 Tax=unclassified Nostoc TaxID=2593658 RepID=UPI002AD576EF|nr:MULTISPECIES: hypothetical protein [unclassified Nostoc]MDZ7986457.1 hypothetical protein [Nostoc sp. DedVER02]MDZ8114043.1 hypothetical protein [Nostoc sp. DedVER01b]